MNHTVISLLLRTLVITALLTGCGSSFSNEKSTETGAPEKEAQLEETPNLAEADPQLEKTIQILSIWPEDHDNGVLINEICRKYQEEVNPNFNWEYEVVASEDLKQSISTLAASNDLPDIFVYESGKPIRDLIEEDKIVNLSEVLENYECLEALNPSAISLLSSLSGTEDIYDLPLGLNVEGFWYHKALFEKAGVEVPKTWEELEEVLAKLQQAGIQPIAAGGADKWGVTRLINANLVRNVGPDAMKKAANGEADYTDAAYVAAAQTIQDWANQGYFGEDVTTVTMDEAGYLLMNEKAAIFYNGSWFTLNLNDRTQNLAGEEGIGFFNVPVVSETISAADSYSMNCGNILCFGKGRYEEATGWFVKYFVENMGDTAMRLQGTVKGYRYDENLAEVSGYTQLALDHINSAKSAFTWFESDMGSEVSTVAQENVQGLLKGELTAEEYMQSIQDVHDLSK